VVIVAVVVPTLHFQFVPEATHGALSLSRERGGRGRSRWPVRGRAAGDGSTGCVKVGPHRRALNREEGATFAILVLSGRQLRRRRGRAVGEDDRCTPVTFLPQAGYRKETTAQHRD
jgi:hypothetical protein